MDVAAHQFPFLVLDLSVLKNSVIKIVKIADVIRNVPMIDYGECIIQLTVKLAVITSLQLQSVCNFSHL